MPLRRGASFSHSSKFTGVDFGSLGITAKGRVVEEYLAKLTSARRAFSPPCLSQRSTERPRGCRLPRPLRPDDQHLPISETCATLLAWRLSSPRRYSPFACHADELGRPSLGDA